MRCNFCAVTAERREGCVRAKSHAIASEAPGRGRLTLVVCGSTTIITPSADDPLPCTSFPLVSDSETRRLFAYPKPPPLPPRISTPRPSRRPQSYLPPLRRNAGILVAHGRWNMFWPGMTASGPAPGGPMLPRKVSLTTSAPRFAHDAEVLATFHPGSVLTRLSVQCSG